MSFIRLKKSDVRKLSEQIGFPLDKKDAVEVSDDILLVNKQFFFFKLDGTWVPSVRLLLEDSSLLPHLVVDMGAVRFVAGGADIMRPGIVECPSLSSGSFVAVVDENNLRPFAVGRLKVSSEELLASESGKLVENLHYVGDKLWNTYVTIK